MTTAGHRAENYGSPSQPIWLDALSLHARWLYWKLLSASALIAFLSGLFAFLSVFAPSCLLSLR